jgi:hypothetical protein
MLGTQKKPRVRRAVTGTQRGHQKWTLQQSNSTTCLPSARMPVPVKAPEPENDEPCVLPRPCPCCGGRMLIIGVALRLGLAPRANVSMPCVQIAGHRPALPECARWRSPTVPAAVKSPSSALVPAARLPGSASWAFSGDLLHGAEPPPSSRRASSNPHSASRTLGAPPSAISSLGQLPTPAVGACGSVAVAGPSR